jgi:hypothetical protein
MAVTAITTTFVGITFYKDTEANLAVAASAQGIGNLEEEILPVSLEQGTISSTSGSNSVSGIGTDFTDNLAGQYLYYYDDTGVPELIGKVLSVSSATSLVLTADATITKADVYYGFTNTVVGRRENILVRIPVIVQSGGGSVIMPYWNNFRASGSGSNLRWSNNAANGNLERYSTIDSPTVPISPAVNIPYTITPKYGYVPEAINNGGPRPITVYFLNSAAFPQFCFALLNPYGDSNNPIPANSLYKLFASERFELNGIVVSPNYPVSTLQEAGY